MNVSEEFAYKEGEHVLCFEPVEGRARCMYDAKVVTCLTKKKNEREYKVNFTDFSVVYKDRNKRYSLSRSIPEMSVYKVNQRHTRLQRRLFRAANSTHKEKERVKLVEEVLEEAFQQGKIKYLPPTSETLDDNASDVSTDIEDQETDESETEEDEEEDIHKVTVEIPENLKKILEADCRMIKCENKLHTQPGEDVVTVLQKFLHHYASMLLFDRPKQFKDTYKAEKRIELTQEILEGLRVLFDVLLPRNLLYNEETALHEQLMSQPKADISQSVEDDPFSGSCDQPEKETHHEYKAVETPRRQTRQSVSELPADPPIIAEDVTKSAKVNRILQRLGGTKEKAMSESGSASSVPQKKSRLAAHLLANMQQASTSGRSTPVNQAPSADCIFREVTEWRLLSSEVEFNEKPLPSVKYGVHHLLRLFVKLPDILTGMKLAEEKKTFIVSVMDAILSYLNNEGSTMFKS